MRHFTYRDGVLHAEQVPVPHIVAETSTPVYIYSASSFRDRCRAFQQGLAGLDHLICYAVKANSNQAVLKILADQGAGFDVVSGGEYERAIAAGAAGDRIVFSGVGKTPMELRRALTGGVRHINVESESELDSLEAIAAATACAAPACLRVNPDIDAGTHEKISTGRADNKFGVPISRAAEVYSRGESLPHVDMCGIAVHIGSQITSLEPFELAWQKILELANNLQAAGMSVSRLDLGGGLGVRYRADESVAEAEEFCALVHRLFAGTDYHIEIEPGRNIAAESGILVSSAILEKTGRNRRFLVLDAGMNDLARPSIYGSYHGVMPVAQTEAGEERHLVDIVGPVCESADTFGRNRKMASLQSGDLVAFEMAGAYCAVMASEYNTRPLVAEALVDAEQFSIIRPRSDIHSIIERDIVPDWLLAPR